MTKLLSEVSCACLCKEQGEQGNCIGRKLRGDSCLEDMRFDIVSFLRLVKKSDELVLTDSCCAVDFRQHDCVCPVTRAE